MCGHRCATTTTHWTLLPHHHHRRRRRRQYVKDAAQDVLEEIAEGVVKDLAFGARAARALLATPLLYVNSRPSAIPVAEAVDT